MAQDSTTLHSLGLAGDLDEADMVRDIEAAFGVAFGDAPIAWRRVGDVEVDLLRLFPPQALPGRCATMMAFHRLRTALAIGRAGPRVAIRELGVSPGALKMLGRDLGLRVPILEADRRGVLGLLLLCFACPASVLLGLATMCWWPFAICLGAGSAFVAVDRGRLGKLTLGELSREIAVLNYGTLAARGADRRLETIRSVLYTLACSHTRADAKRVTSETLLY